MRLRGFEWKRAMGLCVCAMGLVAASAQTPVSGVDEQAKAGAWGDQGDGTYENPVLPADFSDLDAIRVGSTYYAISSTMQYSPGMTVLASPDLVNWKVLGGVVPDLTVLDPELNWDRMNRAGRGIWAGAIRFHAGLFWVYFATPDQGIFMSTAKSAAGPWTPATLVLGETGWDDTCPFWDDDGAMYVVTSQTGPEGPAAVKYNVHVFGLTAEGKQIVTRADGTRDDLIIHNSRGSEANKMYRWNGMYYHYFSEVAREGRVAMMERAKTLDGPWEIRQLNHVHGAVDKEPNQGGIVQAEDGRWWFFTHQGKGDWEGRAAVLLPVTWVDGWPVIGRVGADGIGEMVWRGTKPVAGAALSSVVASDEFDGPVLKPEWGWNYQPRAEMWSLTERRGFLRLHAFEPLKANDPRFTGDVLTQRAFRSARNEFTVKLDLSGMVSGQEAGLTHFAKTAAALSVVQVGTVRTLTFTENGARTLLPVIHQESLWLRSTWGFDGVSQFSYSLDGKTFVAAGEPYQLTWGSYRGDRVGVFTVNSKVAGWIDVDSVRYEVAR